MEEDNHNHPIDPEVYTKDRVNSEEYKIRAEYEHKQLMYQTIFMVVASIGISLWFYLSLNSDRVTNA